MPQTPLSNTPYPSGSDAPAAAADMMALAMAADAKLVLPAIDEADRDSKYSDAPASTVVASGDSQKLWMKTGALPTQWLEIYGDSGEVTEGFTTQTDWSIGAYCFARKWGPMVEVCAELIYNGDDDITDNASPGNISPDFTVVTIPAKFANQVGSRYRTFIWTSSTSAGSGMLYGSGNCVIRDIHPGGYVRSGDWVRFSITFLN